MAGGSKGFPAAIAGELSRRYEYVGELGHGGMGVVYKARHRLLDRPVAIKVMNENLEDDRTEFSDRFIREARIAAELDHAGIVRLLAFDEINGTRYFVMPYLDGETLRSRLLREGRLAEEQAARIVCEVADALAYAHAHGIFHRDIKPENILLTIDPERAMVLDFGIAKSANDLRLTSTGQALGTWSYMSPEQWATDRDLDGRADIYSLGIVAYEVVAGMPPFTGGWAELMQQHSSRKPSPLHERVPNVSRNYAAAVMRCLEKDRNARWLSAADLANDIRAAKDNDPDPPELRAIRHVLSYGIIGGLIVSTWGAAIISDASPENISDPVLIALWALGFAVPLLASAWSFAHTYRRNVKAHSLGDALKVGLRVPSRWYAWWPRRFLSPAQRTRQLPKVVRRTCAAYESLYTIVILALALFGVWFNVWNIPTLDQLPRLESSPVWLAFTMAMCLALPLLVATSFAFFIWSWWQARLSIGWLDDPRANRLFRGLRTSALWQEPWLLAMTRNRIVARQQPANFAELLSDLLATARVLVRSGWILRPLFSSMLQKALDAHEEWKREAKDLEADARISGAQEMRSRIRALEAIRSPRNDQIEESNLLRQQIALYNDRLSRFEEVNIRSQRLQKIVAELWYKLHEMVAKDPEGPEAQRLLHDVSQLADTIESTISAPVDTVRLSAPTNLQRPPAL